MNPILWVKVGLFAAKLFFKYGPKLIELGMKWYRNTERHARRTQQDADEESRALFKQADFDNQLEAKKFIWAKIMGGLPTPGKVNDFREDIWEKMNPGKKSKYRNWG